MTALATRVLEPEVLNPESLARTVRVILLRSPFSFRREEHTVAEGTSLAAIIDELGLSRGCTARVFIDDLLVPEAWWSRVRPRAGHVVLIRAVPQGGDGGDKSFMQLLLGVVLIVVGIFTTEFGIGGFLITAGIGMVIGGVAGLLFPPPRVDSLSGEGPKISPTLSITGAQNRAAHYAPIPRIYGIHRVFPSYGAAPYTEIDGGDQWLRLLFVIGYGPLHLTDFKIGDTPLDQYTGLTIEVRNGFPDEPPLTLYPGEVHEEPLSVLLTYGASFVRTSRAEASELSVDINYPFGLFQIDDDDGDTEPFTVDVFVEYRNPGGVWAGVGTLSMTGNGPTALRSSMRWTTSGPGVYEVRMTRMTPPADPDRIRDHAVWSALRSFVANDPVLMPGLCKVALRIKATDQLNGVINTFNCVAHALLPNYDPLFGGWFVQGTSSPAAAYRDVLQGPANPRPVGDDRIDLETLQIWSQDCAAKGLEFNAVVDSATTVFQLLRDISAIGRAGLHMRDGLYSVVRDVLQTVPRAHFTPRNSRGFRGRKAFPDFPHALKVRFVNRDSWQQDEIVVYDDGYNLDGAGEDMRAATLFESLELWGCTSATQAWKTGRYHLATARLRPELYELTLDVEYLVVERGDLVKVTHDVPFWGLGSARVLSVTVDGNGNALSVTADDVFPMAAGTNYVARFRLQTGDTVVSQVVTVEGESATLTFTSPIAAAQAPVPGDLMMFGRLDQESANLIVRSIEPHGDLTATLTLVDAAPGVHTADTGAIPPFNPQITLPPVLHRVPAQPIVDSHEDVGTSIVITYHFPSGTFVTADQMQARYRISGTDGAYTSVPAVAADSGQITIGPVEVRTYDVLLRAVNTVLGLASDWLTVTHTVGASATAPADVMFLAMEGSTALKWKYPAAVPVAGFKVRVANGDTDAWADGLPAHTGLLAGSSFPIPGANGEQTWMVKAVDALGRESAAPAVVVKDLGAQEAAHPVETVDLKALGFPGAVENGSIVGGDLVADDADGLFWGPDAERFWKGADGDDFWVDKYRRMVYLATLDVPSNRAGMDLLLDATVQGDPYTIEYGVGDQLFWGDDGDPFWGPDAALFWPAQVLDFLPWPGRLTHLEEKTYTLRVTTGAGPLQGEITALSAIYDAPTVKESLADVAIGSGGTRLPITKTYTAITTVALTLQDDGGAAFIPKVMDKDPALGPLVNVYNSSFAATTGVVDALIEGY